MALYSVSLRANPILKRCRENRGADSSLKASSADPFKTT